MIVADTSLLCYLVLSGCVDVLPAMFGRVEIPGAVRDELSASDAPPPVSAWMARPPGWLGVYAVEYEPDAALRRLHSGEREAIILAEQLGADLIVLDEKPARRVATERGLRITGTLGVLKEASARGLIDLPSAVERLRQTTFRASPRLLQNLLKEHS